MMTHHQRLQASVIAMSCIFLLAIRHCLGAESTDELFGQPGTYSAQDDMPDTLTTTPPSWANYSLEVTDGSASFASDSSMNGMVTVIGKHGGTAVFWGRPPLAGCTFTVNGKRVYHSTNGGRGASAAPSSPAEPIPWTNTFENNDAKRLQLEINEDGKSDDYVLITPPDGIGGKLRIKLLNPTPDDPVEEVSLTASNTNISPPPTPQTVSDTQEWVEVNLTGLDDGVDDGDVTITATIVGSSPAITSSITAKVFKYRIKVVHGSYFDGRSFDKLGIRETGILKVETPDGIDPADFGPYAWTPSVTPNINPQKTDFQLFEDFESAPKKERVRFDAGDYNSSVTITLTDKDSHTITTMLSVVEPTGVYQVNDFSRQWQFTSDIGTPNEGAEMHNNTYLLPKDVSFTRVYIIEKSCFAENARGAEFIGFKNSKVSWMKHPEWPGGEKLAKSPNIDTGCIIDGPNYADATHTLPWDRVLGVAPQSMPVGNGFDWNIPWCFSTLNRKKVEFSIVTQRHDIYAAPAAEITPSRSSTIRMSISKAGTSVP